MFINIFRCESSMASGCSESAQSQKNNDLMIRSGKWRCSIVKKKTKPELLCRYMKMDGTFNRNSPEWTRLTESKMCKDRMLPKILIA